MAPLRVGDYIEYSGVTYNGEVLLYGLVANIDILTSGDQPGYVRVEDAIIGIADTGVDVEAARARVNYFVYANYKCLQTTVHRPCLPI